MGIDSASQSGFCLLDGDRIVARGTINAREPRRVDTFASFVCSKARPDLVAIEDSYLAKNVNTVKVLSRVQGMWAFAFGLRGVPIEYIMANTWQKALLTGLIRHGSKSADCKKAAALWVKATYGLTVPGDVADAIGLATFVARRDAVAARAGIVGAMPSVRM